MAAIYYESYLAHHGVKGMKWGVRKARKSTRVTPSRSSRDRDDDQTYTRQVATKRTTQQPRSNAYDQGQTQTKSWVSRHKGLVIGLSVAGVAAGAIVANRVLKNRAKAKLSDFTEQMRARSGENKLKRFAKNFKVDEVPGFANTGSKRAGGAFKGFARSGSGRTGSAFKSFYDNIRNRSSSRSGPRFNSDNVKSFFNNLKNRRRRSKSGSTIWVTDFWESTNNYGIVPYATRALRRY